MKPLDTTHFQSLDNELVSITQNFLLLSPLSWPKETMIQFLDSFARGNLSLPNVEYPKLEFHDKITALNAYIAKLQNEDTPVYQFLRMTAESYLYAYEILQGIGTKSVTTYSKLLYGSPNDTLTGYKRSSIDIARYFVRVVEDYHCSTENTQQLFTASQFKTLLEERINETFPTNTITVTIDNAISARATAGSNYVKIRAGANFSYNDLDQLFHHEVMTHTLTYINGRRQPLLKTLGYNAPRTASTQEGLAVFSEYINSSIELHRLRRIALRILAIDMAEEGADFIELFRFFQDHGQNTEESYYSAMRIFRGGIPQGGIVFYKDNIYLSGLIEIGSFLKKAMHSGFIHDIALLFCGKLTTDDVLLLKPMSEQGLIIDPEYLPAWATNSSTLASHLAINDLTERFKLEELEE